MFSSDTNTSVGDAVSLACTGAGAPSPAIAWTRGRAPLASGTYTIRETRFSNDSSHFTTSVLELCNLQLADFEQYVCTASSNLTEGTSTATASLLLQVHGKSGLVAF